MLALMIVGAYGAVWLWSARLFTHKLRESDVERLSEYKTWNESREDVTSNAAMGVMLGLFWPITLLFVALLPFISGKQTSYERERDLKQREDDVKRKEEEIRNWTPPTL